MELLESRQLLSANGAYVRANLVSDQPGRATNTDAQLINAWGLAATATGPWWVADAGAGVSTSYNGAGQAQSPVAQIPPPAGSTDTAAPTGLVANSTADFVVIASGRSGAAVYIFATEDGTLSGWNPDVDATHAVLAADQSASGAVYKGLASGAFRGKHYLYATDFHNGKIDVFDGSFKPVASSGKFSDQNIPSGFAPFGIANLKGHLFVTYAKQDADRHDDVAGAGKGFIDEYSTDGRLLRRVATRGPLNSPWGLAMAPAGFGQFSNDLLVGNFGDGRINAYQLKAKHSAELRGQLRDASRKPIRISGLWGLAFGNDHDAGSSKTLFFAAGPGGEEHGLFGSIAVAPVVKQGGGSGGGGGGGVFPYGGILTTDASGGSSTSQNGGGWNSHWSDDLANMLS